ncbi:MAG: endonuclease [Ignavibacteriaceae bacterium]|nr:MAG: endonuclease/exonuclease/phosphatase family protein [Chlorobiota bacterium]GJQ32222.1 MAG: endonuclease [Ignavibacteriaceae bacterium]
MKNTKFLLFFIVLYFTPLFSQGEGGTIYIASYNVENLFDTINDPAIDDEQFLPSDSSNWNSEKYHTKLKNLAQVIDSMNGGWGPDILGLVEVENRTVIEELMARIKNGKNYGIVHFESPDGRGIDCAMIFNKQYFTLSKADTAIVTLPNNWPTRSILHATMLSPKGIEYHFFVNHWPSRRGGQDKSEDNRIAAASRLRAEIDKLFADDPNTNIIIMGDFNDEPTDKSITEVLKAAPVICDFAEHFPPDAIYNLSLEKKIAGEGSYKFQGNWSMIDQMLISGNVLKTNFICGSYGIFNPAFIRQKGPGKYEGASLPTFGGRRYFGGYSDHFAIYAIFKLF